MRPNMSQKIPTRKRDPTVGSLFCACRFDIIKRPWFGDQECDRFILFGISDYVEPKNPKLGCLPGHPVLHMCARGHKKSDPPERS